MKKKPNRKPESKETNDEWLEEAAAEELEDPEALAEWQSLMGDSRRLAALRAIEIAREEMALRRALDDFPE